MFIGRDSVEASRYMSPGEIIIYVFLYTDIISCLCRGEYLDILGLPYPNCLTVTEVYAPAFFYFRSNGLDFKPSALAQVRIQGR
ncbi:hypothetical protein EVAR_55732_1 [Eumeta japonica]|uniref:Uncharacterized protein n=1 Tax=Eumeta variegata TaxID=151549 RepID=A0A4C1YY56_EUMVA|nr:hypothetical protein EVAR_55732_1 [Eumeta japonica]